jgi:hypothetical protein
MKVHAKKCHPGPFQAVRDGSKPFEWRKEDDCRFQVGDLLLLLEYLPEMELVPLACGGFGPREAGYTGEVERRRITYVLRDRFGVPPGYVVLGLAPEDRP